MMHSKKRIIKRVVIACLILVVSGVWLVGYIDVNKRFPKPEQQVHSLENGKDGRYEHKS